MPEQCFVIQNESFVIQNEVKDLTPYNNEGISFEDRACEAHCIRNPANARS